MKTIKIIHVGSACIAVNVGAAGNRRSAPKPGELQYVKEY